jgi:hypothetical protein
MSMHNVWSLKIGFIFILHKSTVRTSRTSVHDVISSGYLSFSSFPKFMGEFNEDDMASENGNIYVDSIIHI